MANGGFTNAIPWGDSHHEELEKRLGSMMAIAVIGDDLPELHNSVELDPDLTDSDGVPAPARRFLRHLTVDVWTISFFPCIERSKAYHDVPLGNPPARVDRH